MINGSVILMGKKVQFERAKSTSEKKTKECPVKCSSYIYFPDGARRTTFLIRKPAS